MEATPNPAKGANDAIDGLTFVAWPSSTATRLGVVDGLTFVAGGCHEAKTREATCDGAREAVRHLPHRRWEGFGLLRGVDSGLDHLQKRLEIGVLGFTGGMGGLALRLPLVCRSHARLVPMGACHFRREMPLYLMRAHPRPGTQRLRALGSRLAHGLVPDLPARLGPSNHGQGGSHARPTTTLTQVPKMGSKMGSAAFTLLRMGKGFGAARRLTSG
jgi:hypothetical protein